MSDPLKRLMIDHYLTAAFIDLQSPNMSQAEELSRGDSLKSVRAAFARLGRVESLEDPNISEIALTSRIHYGAHRAVDVHVSTVLPYAALVRRVGDKFEGFLDERTGTWGDDAVTFIEECGLLVIPGEICQMESPMINSFAGGPVTYFEAIFGWEFGTPGM